MLALVIILAWLLINTLITVAITIADGTGIGAWDEFIMLILCAVFSPLAVLGVLFIGRKMKKRKNKSEHKIYWANEDDE